MYLLKFHFLPLHTKIFSSLLRSVFFGPPKMKTSLCCLACKTPLFPEPYHAHHQRYCLKPACQRARRQRTQQLRRAAVRRRAVPTASVGRASQPSFSREAVWKPYEAVLTRLDPVFIGLIAQFIDSTDLGDIRGFLRRCATRGQDILNSLKVNERFKATYSQGHAKRRRRRIARSA